MAQNTTNMHAAVERKLAGMIAKRGDGVITAPIHPQAPATEVAAYIGALDFNRIASSPAAVGSALLQRLGHRVTNEKLAMAGQKYVRDSLPRMLRTLHHMGGGEYYADPYAMDCLTRAMSSVQANDLFGLAADSALAEGFDSEDDSTGWVSESDAPSFRAFEKIAVEEPSSMQRVARGGTANDAEDFAFVRKATGALVRYGQKFSVDETYIIDDQIDAIVDIPMAFGRMSRRLRVDLAYSILLGNPTLLDAGALFNSTAVTTAGGHANLGSTVLGSAGLTAAMSLMRVQLEPTTQRQLNLKPRHLIVPGALEGTARTLLSDWSLPDDPPLQLHVEPRIDNGVTDPRDDTVHAGSPTAWFIAAGARGVELVYLAGTGRVPQVRTWQLRNGQFGYGFDCQYAMAAVPICFAGLVKGNA